MVTQNTYLALSVRPARIGAKTARFLTETAHLLKGITLLPEVLLSNDLWLNRFPNGEIYPWLKRSLHTWNTGHIIVGALINVPDPAGACVEERMSMQQRYSRYNAALMVDSTDIIDIKLKKASVPVAEYVPPYLSAKV